MISVTRRCHLRTTFLIAQFCAIILPAAAEPATREAAVEAQLAKLSADDWQVRELAREALVRIGEPAVPRLEQLVKESADPNLRSTAAAVILAIAEARATGASIVTLNAASADPGEIIAELFRQARADAGVYDAEPAGLLAGGTLKPIDVAFDHVPFWEAVRGVCAKSNLNVRYIYDRWRYTFMQDHSPPFAGRRPPLIEGPYVFTFDCTNVSSDKSSPQRDYGCNLAIMPEPKIKLAEGMLRIESLTDQDGAKIPACDMSRPNDGPHRWGIQQAAIKWDAEARWYVNLGFRPPPTSKRFTLRGRMELLLGTAFETIEIDDVLKAKDVTRESAGRQFTLRNVTLGRDGYTANVTLHRGELSNADWRTFRDFMQRAQLVDAAGEPLRWGGGGTSSSRTSADIRYEYRRARPTDKRPIGEPARFVWRLPTATTHVQVPFVFADVPLDPEQVAPK